MKKSIVISAVVAVILCAIAFVGVKLYRAYIIADIISDDPVSHPAFVRPLPPGIDVNNLQDCTVPAAFTCDDFRWMGGNLRMKVYNMDLYDAVEVSQLQAGDTVLYASQPIVVQTITREGDVVEINGGLGNEEPGCWLRAYEGGTYVGQEFDDHASYTMLGTAELALAQDFVIVDWTYGPEMSLDTVRVTDMQKLYLETLPDFKRFFSPLDTRVTVTDGMITEISRHWIP